MRFANTAMLIGVPENVKAQATVVRQEKEVIQYHHFSHIEFKLPRIKGYVGEFHPKRFQGFGPGNRIFGGKLPFLLQTQEIFRPCPVREPRAVATHVRPDWVNDSMTRSR
jgi:hypothetical protein